MSNIRIDDEGVIYRKDSETGEEAFLGNIQDGVAHLVENPGGNIKGQIRKAANEPDLTFTLAARSPQTDSPDGVVVGAEPEEVAPKTGVAGATNPSPKAKREFDLTGAPPKSDARLFQRWFINNYSPSGWNEYNEQQ